MTVHSNFTKPRHENIREWKANSCNKFVENPWLMECDKDPTIQVEPSANMSLQQQPVQVQLAYVQSVVSTSQD